MWYRLIRAGKYIGSPPWDLERQSMTWLLAAEAAQTAEAAQQRAQQSKQGRGRHGASRSR
jgi:hypothetical protein